MTKPRRPGESSSSFNRRKRGEARRALEELAQHGPTKELRTAAGAFAEGLLSPSPPPPEVTFDYGLALDDKTGRKSPKLPPNKQGEDFAKAARKLPKKYTHQAFQCFADYDTCVHRETRKARRYMCAGVMALCLAERIIPFAGSGGSNGD